MILQKTLHLRIAGISQPPGEFVIGQIGGQWIVPEKGPIVQPGVGLAGFQLGFGLQVDLSLLFQAAFGQRGGTHRQAQAANNK